MSALARPQRRGMNSAWGRDAEGPSTSDASLRFKVFTCGRIGYARVSGPLDVEAIRPFREHLHRLLDAGCRALILDLSGVQFVDSQGVRALLQLRDAVEKRRVWLRVVVPQGSPVERTLRLLRFDALFSIFGSVSSAWRRRFSRDGRQG